MTLPERNVCGEHEAALPDMNAGRPGPLAKSPGADRLGCNGCHDGAWNGHPSAPRETMPMRCVGCPVHRLMLAAGIRLNPLKVAPPGTGKTRRTRAFETALQAVLAR